MINIKAFSSFNSTMVDSAILSFFPKVSTHLKHTSDHTLSTQLFPYECLIAALAISFNRYTIKYPDESKVSRLFWSALLGGLAYADYGYWILISLHLISFGQYFYSFLEKMFQTKDEKKLDTLKMIQLQSIMAVAYSLLIYFIFSMAHPEHTNAIFQTNLYNMMISTSVFDNDLISTYVKTHIMDALGSLLPIAEFQDAYNILTEFIEPSVLNAKMGFLGFITFHIQTGMGFLGIDFLRNEQNRKNALIKIEDEVKKQKEESKNNNETDSSSSQPSSSLNDKQYKDYDASKKFRQSAGPFIFFVALPYMAQIVFYGAVNMYTYHCFRDDIHRTIRLNDLFDEGGHRFVATSIESTLSPASYATNSETVVDTVYNLFNTNLFSLPKLMLLPQVIAKQPMLLVKITPLILLSDYVKSAIVSTITTETERISKEVKEMEALRNKIEQYDIKNSELIQRSGYDSIAFTEQKWVKLTEDIQELEATSAIMKRSKMYFQWLQRHFVMMALVDCALAKLIAVGKIGAADIFVFARAIEDFIGFILMRSRAESELASMKSSVKILRDLKTIWNNSSNRNLLECTLDESGSETIDIKDLSYTRGSAAVQIKDIQLSKGNIYAISGANGSGKSTLFRVLGSCSTNRKSIDMDSSIVIKNPGNVKMSSANVVEIAQNFYWPLNTAPADWIYHTDVNELEEVDRKSKISQLAIELQSLKLFPETKTLSELEADLLTIKDDWFADLSGGQKSKVELVRKVFLHERCPNVLLIDETFAPLDPDSKNLVMQKIKEFCNESIVLVIYHADVKVKDDNPENEEVDEACVDSSNFFDANIHVSQGELILRPVCDSVSEIFYQRDNESTGSE